MGKHKLKSHHLYLGAGGVIAVVALVVALTFGLSSAQYSGGSSYTPPSGDSGSYTPPPSTYTPPPIDSGTYIPPPSGGLNCTGGQFPCYSENVCKPTGSSCNDSGMGGGQYPMPSGCTTAMPTSPCGSGQHYECQSNAWTCKADQYSGSMMNMPDCAAGQMPTAANPCRLPSPPSCPSGQWWDYLKLTCTSTATGTMSQPVSNVQQTCPANQMPCQPMNNACSSPEACALVTPVCGPNEYSTPQKACKPSATTQPIQPTQPTTGGDCWNSSSPDFASQACTQMRASVNDAKTQQPQNACAAGEHRDWNNNCVKDMIPGDQQWQNPKPGECPQEMISCPDKWSPNGTSCRTRRFFEWDQKTQTSTERAMTCESWAVQDSKWQTQGPGGTMGNMGNFGNFGKGPGPMPWFGDMKGQGMNKSMNTTNPCEFNPNDPFCKAGVDFNAMQDQYKFDESQFQPQEYKMNASDIKREVKNLKMDVKNWTRDVQQVKQQLKEIGRESSGFACPAAVEVNAILQQYEDAINTVNALNENSSQEEIQKARALGDFIRGRWQDGEQVVEGLQQKLYGGPMDENGNRKAGKMESLNVCRELSNVIREANGLLKGVSKEAKQAEKSGAPKEILNVFKEVLDELQAIATNPVGVLQSKGVSLEEISQPWQPDPEVCSFGGGWGPGPMPMEMGTGGPGGFGGMEGFDPEMMEMMMQKFQEMQKGEGNFQGFNPFGASVLTAQANDEGFGGPEFGPQEPPEECMPPVQRYLSPHRLMRKLDEARMGMGKQFESMNSCKMLEKAKEHLAGGENEGFGGPPQEVLDLVESGVWQEACDSNDTETLAKIKSRLMRLGPPGGPGQKNKRSLGGLIDIDKLVEEKLSEKLGQLFGEENEKTASQMKALEARIAELQSKLDDAAKTIFALNERLSDMATKLASAIELNEQATRAVNSIAKLPDEAVQNSVTTAIDTLADKAEEVKAVLPAEADKLVDATVNSLIASPPSEQVMDDISDRFNALASYAASGAKTAEVVEKAKDELAEVAVLNSADVNNKVAVGIVASRDTADLSQWYAVPALQAKGYGFIARELTEIKPAEPETKCAALTRVARVVEKATGEEIDMEDKSLDVPVPGAPDWCLPFLSHLQEQNVPFVENLRDPNAPIDRGEVAVLIHQAIGDRLPDPASIAEYLTPDMKNLPVDMQNAIAEIRFNGIMDTTDGTNFSPYIDFNRAQNALVSTKTFEVINAAGENQ